MGKPLEPEEVFKRLKAEEAERRRSDLRSAKANLAIKKPQPRPPQK